MCDILLINIWRLEYGIFQLLVIISELESSDLKIIMISFTRLSKLILAHGYT